MIVPIYRAASYNLFMPDYNFYYPIEVRYADLDPQGHVNNACYLTYFEQARVAYLIHLELFGADQSFKDIGIIIAEAHVTYKAPIHFGAEIKIGVRVSRIGNKSMSMEYGIFDVETGLEMASGASAIVTFDYRSHQTIAVPAEWRAAIATFERLND
jgi:acyl-CoA thioester hydrolase